MTQKNRAKRGKPKNEDYSDDDFYKDCRNGVYGYEGNNSDAELGYEADNSEAGYY